MNKGNLNKAWRPSIFHPLQLAGRSQYSSDHSSTTMNLSQRTLCYYFLQHRPPLFSHLSCHLSSDPLLLVQPFKNIFSSVSLLSRHLALPQSTPAQLLSFYLSSSHTVLCATFHSIYTDFQLTFIDMNVATKWKICQRNQAVSKNIKMSEKSHQWLNISSGFSVTRRRQLSWRLRWQKLRTPSLRPSSSYHSWMENTHDGTRRFDMNVDVCVRVRHLLRKGLVYHVRATGGERETERETGRGMFPAVLGPFWLFLPHYNICLHLN